jgi:hypothetical protein
MSAIAGFLNTLNAATNDLVGEFQEAVLARHAKGHQSGSILFGLMAKLSNESSDNTEFNWWERDPVQRTIYSAANVTTTTGTTLTFDDGASGDVYALLAKGDVLMNARTNEYVRVSADPTTNSVVVVRQHGRDFGAPTASTINDNDEWTIITRAIEEGSLSARGQYEQPGVNTNFIQTFNQSLELTRQYKNQVLRTDSAGPLREARIQALERISNDIELAYLFGVKERKQGSNGMVYSTGGIKAAVDAFGAAAAGNKLNGGGTSGVSLDNLNAWFQSVLQVGSDSKLLFAGPLAYAALSNYANSGAAGYRYVGTDYVFGMNITEVQTPFGNVGLVNHPLMKERPAFQDWGILVDLQFVTQKVLTPLLIEENIQQNGQHAYKEQFYAELGLKTKFANAHGYAYGLRKITTT